MKITPKIIRLGCVFFSILVWTIPGLHVLLTRKVVAESIGRSEWWIPCILFLVSCLHILFINHVLVPFLKNQNTAQASRIIIPYLMGLLVLSFLPILQLRNLEFINDTAAPEWVNWSYIFIGLFCSIIITVEICSFNLLQNRNRLIAYSLGIFYLFLSPAFKIASYFNLTDVHDYQHLLDPNPVLYTPTLTILGIIFSEIGSWHYFVLFLIFLLVVLDRNTTFLSGKPYPLLFFLLFVSYSSGMVTSLVHEMTPLIELSTNTRKILFNVFPRQSHWLTDNYIIYPPDSVNGAWLQYGPLRRDW